MRSRTTHTIRTALALALVSAGASAQDLPGNLQFHGFASQGYLNSSANNYIAVKTEPGSFAMTEAAFNVTALPIEGLRVGVQLYGRDLGAAGNNNVTVDWAMGDYRWKNWLGVRAGRIKLPLGFYNTLRDVDMARVDILQPSSLYPVSQRDLNAAFDGASVYGTLSLGGGGSLDYEGFLGTQDLDDIYVIERFIRDGAQASLPGLGATGLKGVDYTLGAIQADMEHLYGVSLAWRTPLSGLRLGVSHEQSKSRIQSETTYFGTLGPAPVSFLVTSDTTYDYPYQCVGSAEYLHGGLKLAAEYYRDKVDQVTSLTGIPGPPTAPVESGNEGEAWYVQAAYRFGDRFQAQGYYSVYWPDRDDKDGEHFAQRGQAAFRAWQKDLAFTGRVDFKPHWLLKAEVHFFDGAAGLSLAENPGGFEQDWTLFAVKTTFYF
jgi:hypothetical protein